MKQQNFVLIISSPSGAGKTSIVKKLIENDTKLLPSISVTTRLKRPGEVDGKDYFFVTQEDFDDLKSKDEFLEYANVFGNNYASPKKFVLEKIKEGFDVLFDIDWQGAHSLKEKLGNLAITIFILPPSIEELKRRLTSRNQDSAEVINERMEKAQQEISHYNEYEYIIVNKDFNKTIERIEAIIRAERIRHHDFEDFIKELI